MKRRAFLVGTAAAGAVIPLSSIAAASAVLGLPEPSKRRMATIHELCKDEYGTIWNLCRDYGHFYPNTDGQLVLEARHFVFGGGYPEPDRARHLVCEYGFNEQVESPFDDAEANRHYDARPLRERVLGSQSWMHRRLKWNLMSKGYIPYNWDDHDAPPRPTVPFEESVASEIMFDFVDGKIRDTNEDTQHAYINKRWPVYDSRIPKMVAEVRVRSMFLSFLATFDNDAREYVRRHFYSIHEAGRFGQRSLDP